MLPACGFFSLQAHFVPASCGTIALRSVHRYEYQHYDAAVSLRSSARRHRPRTRRCVAAPRHGPHADPASATFLAQR